MLRPFASAAILTSGLIVAAMPGTAQQYRYPNFPQSQSYGNAGPLDRVQQDLDRVAGQSYLDAGARGNIEHARQKIWEFQRRWASGRFDSGKLKAAMGDIHHAANHPSMDYRNRRSLAEDLSRIADVRARRANGPAYGYR